MTTNRNAAGSERGFVLLIALIATVIPLLLILGASSQAMRSRQSRLEGEIADERALVAAEAGLDATIYQASTLAGLTSGVPITRDLGDGMRFTVHPTFLRTDGLDNDGDAAVDEADENLYQVLVEGHFGGRQRRLVAYLGPQPVISSLPGAMTLLDPFPGANTLQLQGSALLDGHDKLLTGAPGNPLNDTNGVMIESPYTTAQLLANIPAGQQSHAIGTGPAPSVGQTTMPYDMTKLQLSVQNAANIVLTAAVYNNKQFGNGLLNQYNIIYRNGDVLFKGMTHGAGILFVNGNLYTAGRFEFDGIIIVTGAIEMNGNTGSRVFGGILVGANSPHAYLQGNIEVHYSTQAIAGAVAVAPNKYVAFNGWQEISRQ